VYVEILTSLPQIAVATGLFVVWRKSNFTDSGKNEEGEKQNAADGHLRRTGDRRSAMVKHKAIARDYCIKAGISCQQQKKRAPDEIQVSKEVL